MTILYDRVFVAQYEEKPSVVVDFVSNGGNSVDDQTIEVSALAVKPADPTRAGYTFNGWYSDEARTQLWDFETPITSNQTLYADWIMDPAQPSTKPTTKVTIKKNPKTGVAFYVGEGSQELNITPLLLSGLLLGGIGLFLTIKKKKRI